MSSRARRCWWPLAVIAALCALAAESGASRRTAAPGTSVGRVCLGGLRVDLARGRRTAADAPRPLAGIGGRCGGPGEGGELPGALVLAALSADERSALLVRALDDPAVAALDRTLGSLERAGWVERPASALARARRPTLPVGVVERAGALLFVVSVARPSGATWVLCAGWAGAPDMEEER